MISLPDAGGQKNSLGTTGLSGLNPSLVAPLKPRALGTVKPPTFTPPTTPLTPTTPLAPSPLAGTPAPVMGDPTPATPSLGLTAQGAGMGILGGATGDQFGVTPQTLGSTLPAYLPPQGVKPWQAEGGSVSVLPPADGKPGVLTEAGVLPPPGDPVAALPMPSASPATALAPEAGMILPTDTGGMTAAGAASTLGTLQPGGAETPGGVGDPTNTSPVLSPAGIPIHGVGDPVVPMHMLDDSGAGAGGITQAPAGSVVSEGFGAPAAQPSTFSASNNLIGSQINPTFDPQYAGRAAQEIEAARVAAEGPMAGTDVSEVNRLLGGAEGAVNGANINTGNFAASADAERARQMLMGSLGSVMGGPDRSQLAADALALQQERTAPQYEQELRDVGRRASALGRVGAGMTTNELTDVFSQRQRDLDLLKRSLSNDAAGQTLADNLSRYGAASGAAGQLRSEDLAGSNFNFGVDQARAGNALARGSALGSLANQRLGVAQTQRADSESDRAYRTALGTTNAGLALNRANAYQGLDDARFARDASMRGEQRTERGYQNDLSQQAFNNKNARAQVEDSLTNSAANRDSDRMRILLGAMGDPNALTNTLLNSSTQQGAQAGQGSSDAMNLLMQYFQTQAKRQGTGTRSSGDGTTFPTSWAY